MQLNSADNLYFQQVDCTEKHIYDTKVQTAKKLSARLKSQKGASSRSFILVTLMVIFTPFVLLRISEIFL